jgi:hypothetical protein
VDVVEIRGDEKDDGGGEKSRREGRGMRMMMMMKGERMKGRKGSPERLFAGVSRGLQGLQVGR